MKNQSYYLELIGRHLAGELSAEQQQELEQWVAADPANRAFLKETEQLWAASDAWEPPSFEANTQRAWAALDQRIDGAGRKAGGGGKRISLFHRHRWMRYAAALLLLLGAYWLYEGLDEAPPRTAMMASISTGAGEQRSVVLPDSSTVVLNERSTLSYPEAFGQRRVELSGEAFFEITHNPKRPFRIEAQGATTMVLGTSFNVRAYPEEPQVAVTVATGKVRVEKTAAQDERLTLQPGETAVLDKPADELREAERENALAWKTGELQFENSTLREVAGTLERYYGVDIRIANEQLYGCRFRGTFREPELQSLLEVLTFTMDLKISGGKETIVIDGNAACK